MVAPKAAKTAQPAAAANPGPVKPAVPLEQWPDKVLFRMGELADLLGVETHVVRFWLKEFPHIRTERSDTNRLLFARPAAEKLWRIRDLLYGQGYTLAGARKALTAVRPPKGQETAAAQMPVAPSGPSKAEVDLASQVQALQADVKALNARLAASQASEAAARARLQQLETRAEQLTAKVQQEAALAQHFQQALQVQQAQQAQQALQARGERDHLERERWSDLAAALGDLAADIRG